jgi:ubiquinone/menaquinone biosynthesis C-methylase UbiE
MSISILKSRWVVDPVNVIVEKINSLKIPASLNHDHDKILDDRIIACNMKKTKLKANSLGVAVFSLSLMHQDWHEYIKEAKRTLTRNGYLIIAEVTRTLTKSDEDEGEGRLYKLKDVLEQEGFRLEDEDTRDRFTFITAVRK